METKIVELLSDNTALPVLFIGSGLSRRYLDLPDWEGLLKQYCVKPFEYYNDKAARACRDNPEMRLPTAADYIEEDFNERWYIDDAYAESRETHREEMERKISPFKICIADYFRNASNHVVEKYQEEVAFLGQIGNKNISCVITTNYDCFLEKCFGEGQFQTYIGQDDLLFSTTYEVGELYKIHGCCTKAETIVINADDYIKFAKKSAYLSSKILTMFLERPIIFLGCRYYEIFQSKGFRKCAIISSYTPQAGDLRTDTVSDEEETETFEKYSTYLKMIGVDPSEDKTQIAKKVEAFEAEAKRKFVDEPANMKLLIVVDKLLTGFDAPSCTYLYIDKAMHDHGLFQAICRVNRLDGESKDFGYIVDYKELFGDLADAMNKYTAGAFESYDAEDVDGLLKDRATEAKKYFVDTLEELNELCEGVELPRKELDYIHYFCGESGRDENQDEASARIREKLYKLVGRLIRAFAELKPRMTDLGYTLSEQSTLDDRVAFYVNMRDTIGRASGDFIDLKAYEPGMRYLIDNYITASESQKIGCMDDFTLLDFIIMQEDKLKSEQKGEQESAAETIENNIRKKVVERMVINPAYYAKMSEILEQLILDRRRGVIAYGQLLDTYMELAKNVAKPEENTKYPESIRSNGALRALYDNCGEDEATALKLHKAIVKARLDGFRNNPVKANKIKRALYQLLNDDSEVERIYQIVVEQEEY